MSEPTVVYRVSYSYSAADYVNPIGTHTVVAYDVVNITEKCYMLKDPNAEEKKRARSLPKDEIGFINTTGNARKSQAHMWVLEDPEAAVALLRLELYKGFSVEKDLLEMALNYLAEPPKISLGVTPLPAPKARPRPIATRK